MKLYKAEVERLDIPLRQKPMWVVAEDMETALSYAKDCMVKDKDFRIGSIELIADKHFVMKKPKRKE